MSASRPANSSEQPRRRACFPLPPLPEAVGDLRHPQRPPGGKADVQQDLEAGRGQARARWIRTGPAAGRRTRSSDADLHLQRGIGQRRAAIGDEAADRDSPPSFPPPSTLRLRSRPRPRRCPAREHARQDGLVMLQVAIDHRTHSAVVGASPRRRRRPGRAARSAGCNGSADRPPRSRGHGRWCRPGCRHRRRWLPRRSRPRGIQPCHMGATFADSL